MLSIFPLFVALFRACRHMYVREGVCACVSLDPTQDAFHTHTHAHIRPWSNHPLTHLPPYQLKTGADPAAEPRHAGAQRPPPPRLPPLRRARQGCVAWVRMSSPLIMCTHTHSRRISLLTSASPLSPHSPTPTFPNHYPTNRQHGATQGCASRCTST